MVVCNMRIKGAITMRLFFTGHRINLATLAFLCATPLFNTGCLPPVDGNASLNAQLRLFQTALKYRTGTQPFAIAGGDFNGDTWGDIATVNQGTGDLSLLLSNGTGDFLEAQTLTAGASPLAIKSLDLNGDGLLDLLVSNAGSNDLSFLAGGAGGVFLAPTSIPLPVGARALDMALADLDADGKPDLVTADSGLGSISILPGLGGGAFGDPVRFIAGNEPRSLALTDITRDGNLDILCINRLSGTMSVFAGDGAGAFDAPSSITVGDRPFKLHITDVNGDGFSDVLVANAGSKDVNILKGDAGGGLTSSVRVPFSSTLLDAAFGDFNGDGKLDLCGLLLQDGTPSLALGMIEVAHGDGAGAFGGNVIYGGGSQSLAMTALDINRDARLDLILADTALDRVSVVFGKIGGGLESDKRYAAGIFPRTLKLKDVDGDGKSDLLVLNFQSKNVSIFKGLGGGAFEAREGIALSDFPRAMALGDLNKDGKTDLLVTTITLGKVSVYLGQTGGTFGTEASFSVRGGGGTSGAEPRSIALGDLNKDGFLDAVTGNSKIDSISVLLGDGTGKLGAATEFFMGNFPLDVHLADLDNDGNLDVVACNGYDPEVNNSALPRVSSMKGLGDGTFDLESRLQFSTGNSPIAMELADITLDGRLDAITLHTSDNFMYLLQGSGDAHFIAGVPESTGETPKAMTVADMNRDGRPDIISANGNETITIMFNRGSLVFDIPMTYYAGADPTDIEAADLNADGLLDIVFTNQSSNDVSVMLGRPL